MVGSLKKVEGMRDSLRDLRSKSSASRGVGMPSSAPLTGPKSSTFIDAQGFLDYAEIARDDHTKPEAEQCFHTKIKPFLTQSGVTECYVVKKEEHVGDFANNMLKNLEQYFHQQQQIIQQNNKSENNKEQGTSSNKSCLLDLRNDISRVLAVKDHGEILKTKTGCMLSALCMKKVMQTYIENVVDKKLDRKNREVGESVEEKFQDAHLLNQWRNKLAFEPEELDLIYVLL